MPSSRSGSEAILTFLFTDIEGSTQRWEQEPEAMRHALARHDALLRHAIEAHSGHIFKTMGDQFCAAFESSTAALIAAVAAQRALIAEAWELTGPLRVRMALHTGVAQERDGDYFGPPVNRVARFLAAAHGGQILLSGTTEEQVRATLPDDVRLRGLGAHRLKDLQQPEPLFQVLHPSLPAEFPPLRSLEAFVHNLPIQLTSFIGREVAMAEVKRLLTTSRLLTLTGAGGCGKTRLALQVAVDLVEEHVDGVWLVELAALADPGLVPQAVASALGVREEAGRPLTATLTDYLRSRSLLLVLDNCEHLLPACARLVEGLLRACPSLRVLASSREGLGVAGEQTYPVPSLSVPDPRRLPALDQLHEFEAVRLFVERAGLSQPSFAVTAENGGSVAAVCQRLDGIPLAIELAAARVKALPVEKILERLDDCFRLLTGGSRTALPRQQTLRALIDWSYDLLSEAERTLLRRLSVFAGGWTLETAEAVCGGLLIADCRLMIEETPSPSPISNQQSAISNPEDVLDLLTSLVEKSLVLYDEQAGEGRYRLLETVRQYAWERLLEEGSRRALARAGASDSGGMGGEADAVRGRHRDWFLALAEQSEPELRGPRQAAWLDTLEVEHDNLRAAFGWCRAKAGEAEAELRLAGALWWFWDLRGHLTEGRERLVGALSREDGQRRGAAWAKALLAEGNLAFRLGDYTTACTRWEESVSLFREIGDRWYLAFSLSQHSITLQQRGDSPGAIAAGEESVALFREVGDTWGIAWALISRGEAARMRGDYATAAAVYDEALALLRELEDKPCLTLVLHNLGWLAQHQADYRRSRLLFVEALTVCRELGIKHGVTALSLAGLAAVAAVEEQRERAARLLAAAEALLAGLGVDVEPADRPHYDHAVAVVRSVASEEAFPAAWAEGRAMTLEEAVRAALGEGERETPGRPAPGGEPGVARST